MNLRLKLPGIVATEAASRRAAHALVLSASSSLESWRLKPNCPNIVEPVFPIRLKLPGIVATEALSVRWVLRVVAFRLKLPGIVATEALKA